MDAVNRGSGALCDRAARLKQPLTSVRLQLLMVPEQPAIKQYDEWPASLSNLDCWLFPDLLAVPAS